MAIYEVVPDGDDEDLFAYVIRYEFDVKVQNRNLTAKQRGVIRRIMQKHLNEMAAQMEMVARGEVKVSAQKTSSSSGTIDMHPDTDPENE